jgi:hypothetical protein
MRLTARDALTQIIAHSQPSGAQRLTGNRVSKVLRARNAIVEPSHSFEMAVRFYIYPQAVAPTVLRDVGRLTSQFWETRERNFCVQRNIVAGLAKCRRLGQIAPKAVTLQKAIQSCPVDAREARGA